jgi:quercetin dioxygenase-like cupin family protein/DNA-binding XRE family transcriptional regulator
MTLFEKIKEIRKSKGFTLREISMKTGVSVNYLSLIERGASNPSIGIINKICDVLDVPIMGLNHQSLNSNTGETPKANQKVGVVRKNMRKMIVLPKSRLKQYLLTPGLQRKLEVVLGESDPGEEHDEEWHSHDGEEFGFVLEGRCEVTVEDKVYVLEEGDSIYFSSNLPHKMKGIGNRPCKTIWVITPPFI